MFCKTKNLNLKESIFKIEKEITVKLFKRPVKFTDKKTGAEKSFDALAIEFPNGKSMDIRSDRYNYRTVDYLNELLESK